MVRKEEIKEIVLSSSDISSACKSLIDMANKRGGNDNITLIIAHFHSEALDQLTDNEAVTPEVISEFTSPSA